MPRRCWKDWEGSVCRIDSIICWEENLFFIVRYKTSPFKKIVLLLEQAFSQRGSWVSFGHLISMDIFCVVNSYNEVLGTMKITLLFQVSNYIRVKKQRNIKSWDQQNYLVIRGFCYIRPLYNEVPLYTVMQ